MYGFTHRRRSPAQVADEVQWIVERYAPDQVWYADDVFTISHPWLANYNAELKRRGIHRPFETITRADRLQSEAAAAALRELGCYRIWIGSESGSQRILDAMQRGVSVEQVRRACKLAQAHGIQVGMFLMWGYEGEEFEDIAATVEHVKATNPDVFFTTVSYPIKGTGYFDKVRERVLAPIAWHEGSDRDYVIAGRRGRDYYKLADQWLRNEVEATRLESPDPARAAELLGAARRARRDARLERGMSAHAHELPPFGVIAAALRATTERLARELAYPGASAPDWNAFEWDVARAVSSMQGITVLLAHRLRWRGPDCWQDFLEAQRRLALQRDARIATPANALARPCSRRIGCVGLKGAALRRLGLYRPGERPMGDVDLLVHASG